MDAQPPPQWRPLALADLCYLLDLGPSNIKDRVRREEFPPATWTGAGRHRMWAWCVIEQWAQQVGHPIRTQEDLDAYILRHR